MMDKTKEIITDPFLSNNTRSTSLLTFWNIKVNKPRNSLNHTEGPFLFGDSMLTALLFLFI